MLVAQALRLHFEAEVAGLETQSSPSSCLDAAARRSASGFSQRSSQETLARVSDADDGIRGGGSGDSGGSHSCCSSSSSSGGGAATGASVSVGEHELFDIEL